MDSSVPRPPARGSSQPLGGTSTSRSIVIWRWGVPNLGRAVGRSREAQGLSSWRRVRASAAPPRGGACGGVGPRGEARKGSACAGGRCCCVGRAGVQGRPLRGSEGRLRRHPLVGRLAVVPFRAIAQTPRRSEITYLRPGSGGKGPALAEPVRVTWSCDTRPALAQPTWASVRTLSSRRPSASDTSRLADLMSRCMTPTWRPRGGKGGEGGCSRTKRRIENGTQNMEQHSPHPSTHPDRMRRPGSRTPDRSGGREPWAGSHDWLARRRRGGGCCHDSRRPSGTHLP
jgi:hypothetical protein